MNRILLIIFGIVLISCSSNGNRKSKQLSDNNSTIEKDKEEIKNLVKQLYKWEDQNQITIGHTAITDENDNIVIGFDTNKNIEFGEQLRKTNLFSKEFLDNYQKIVKTLDYKIKTKEMEWLAGDMPPYGNGANPWCNCQDMSYDKFWEKIEIHFLEINQSDAKLTWTWGQSKWSKDFNYEVKVKKENETWKISYLQGFDFDEFTKRNY